jgi:hypothetical protein
MLPTMFQKDRARALASLSVFEGIDADVLVPGHGLVHRGAMRDVVQRVRERG